MPRRLLRPRRKKLPLRKSPMPLPRLLKSLRKQAKMLQVKSRRLVKKKSQRLKLKVVAKEVVKMEETAVAKEVVKTEETVVVKEVKAASWPKRGETTETSL